MTNQEVIKQLHKIAKNPFFTYKYGLCSLLTYRLKRPDLKYLLIHIVDQWPLNSGCVGFPVPHPTETPREAYIGCSKWSIFTQYGRNRRALCVWFADYLEQNIPLRNK